eukprot:1576959-Rhodomonas_salina.2
MTLWSAARPVGRAAALAFAPAGSASLALVLGVYRNRSSATCANCRWYHPCVSAPPAPRSAR